jgi:hypothetical protein
MFFPQNGIIQQAQYILNVFSIWKVEWSKLVISIPYIHPPNLSTRISAAASRSALKLGIHGGVSASCTRLWL